MKRKTSYFALNREKSVEYIEDSKVENGWRNQIAVIDADFLPPPPKDLPIHPLEAQSYMIPTELWNDFQSLACSDPTQLLPPSYKSLEASLHKLADFPPEINLDFSGFQSLV